MPCTNCSSVKHGSSHAKRNGKEYIIPQPKLPYSGCPGACANVGCPPRTTQEMQQNKQQLRFLQNTQPQLFRTSNIAVVKGVSPSIKRLGNGNYAKPKPFSGPCASNKLGCCC